MTDKPFDISGVRIVLVEFLKKFGRLDVRLWASPRKHICPFRAVQYALLKFISSCFLLVETEENFIAIRLLSRAL